MFIILAIISIILIVNKKTIGIGLFFLFITFVTTIITFCMCTADLTTTEKTVNKKKYINVSTKPSEPFGIITYVTDAPGAGDSGQKEYRNYYTFNAKADDSDKIIQRTVSYRNSNLYKISKNKKAYIIKVVTVTTKITKGKSIFTFKPYTSKIVDEKIDHIDIYIPNNVKVNDERTVN